MPISPGDNVGSYRIIEPLGQGGMATVFKAYHPALDRYVAIKVLHPSFKEDPNFNARFAREARIVAKLDHPNIVPIFDFAEHEGTPYLVMRFVEGKTLKAVLRDGLLPIPRVLAIIHPVTAALAYAHAQGILHRDIKPSNVMRANDGHIFLADFGLARIAQAGDSTISQDMLIGTPQYISPEQARGEPATERSDLYSLGVLLFEMFTGRVPFSADTPYAIIHDHIYTALPLPTSINPNLSEAIERVLLKTLAKDPTARYASATELMTALEQAAGIDAAHVATMSPPPTPITQLVSPPPTVPEPIAPVSPPPVKSSPKLVAKPAPEKPVAAPAPRRGLNRITCAVVAVIALLCLVCIGFMAIDAQSPLRGFLRNIPPPARTPDLASVAKTKVALNPQDAAAHTQLGDELARQKDFEAAYAEYDRAIKLNPRLAIAYIHAGDLAQKQGDLNRALKYYEAGLAAVPGNLELLVRQADLLFQMKRVEDAQMLYDKVLRVDPDNPAANLGMGKLAKMRGEAEEAKRRFSLVVNSKDAPASMIEDAKNQIADLALNPPPDPVAQAKARVNANPQDPEARVLLGDAYAAQKNSDAAFAEYDTAIKLSAKFLHAYAQAGELATTLGDFERANKYFTQGRAIAPDDIELVLGQGDLFFKWKKYDDARAAFERVLKIDPNNAQALWRLANVQRIQGQLADALRNYTRALAIDPNLPEAHFGMGMLMLERGNKDEARRQFQMVVSNPNAPPDLKEQAQKQLSALGEK